MAIKQINLAMGTRASLSAIVLVALVQGCSQEQSSNPEDAAPNFIEGQVVSSEPEAGVWVIAETDGLPTAYRKIVVTDDQGRFVIPDLPTAEYKVWVRGYGLKDSEAIPANPGMSLELSVAPAADAAEAAMIYPASYWLSLLNPPDKSAAWVNSFKLGCQLCHQVGSRMTRVLTREDWDFGLHKAGYMSLLADGLGREALLDAMADWSQRIEAGVLPPSPPRPEGLERNMVITQWGWGDEFAYTHDEIATDKRDPTINAYGTVYAVDLANDRLLTLDPKTHTAGEIKVPTLDGFDTPWCEQTFQPPGMNQQFSVGLGTLGCPSPAGSTSFSGAYANPANPHNPMMDENGKVWITTQIRREWAVDRPAFCNESPAIAGSYQHRQLGYYDPATDTFELIDTCFGTHHLQFDKDGVIWTSGDMQVIGWFDPAKYDPANPETLKTAQGWSPVVVDANGDGQAETPIFAFNYGIIPNPVDGSVWSAQPNGGPPDGPGFPGRVLRYDSATDTHEVFIPPAPGAGPRGLDVDTKGIIWVALGGSGHLGRFDRSRCQQTWGAGDQCPEGWTIYRAPGPLMRTGDDPANERSADFHYYIWVDQFNTLGLGADVVVLNGTGSDSLIAFDQKSETFTTIRIPYPLNSYTRGLDGRIDDPALGWKGRGLWYTNGLDPLFHSEIPRSYIGHIQLRPDPLTK